MLFRSRSHFCAFDFAILNNISFAHMQSIDGEAVANLRFLYMSERKKYGPPSNKKDYFFYFHLEVVIFRSSSIDQARNFDTTIKIT